MNMRSTLRVAALASTCLVPLAVYAADDDFNLTEGAPAQAPAAVPVYNNSITAGVGYQSADSFKFGRYSGLTDKGAFGIGDIDAHGGDDWKSGGTQYYDLQGLNLPLTSRSFNLDFGRQGTYGVNLFYDGIPYYYSNHFQTIYDGSRTGALNGAPPSATPWFNSAALGPFLNTQQLKTQRDRVGGSLKYQPLSDWVITTGLTHEHKEGTQENSLLFGTGKNALLQGVVPPTSNGNPLSPQGNLVYFPQPIDYDTDRYDAKIAYNGQQLQGELGYTFSSFTDNIASFNAIDPFSSPTQANGNGNNLGPPGTTIQAAYSLPPSNTAHYIKGIAGYNLPWSTRIVGTFQYGMLFQNATYTPVTLSTRGPATIGNSVPFTGRDAKVQTFFGNLTITSRPLPRLDLKASYTVDDYDNDTGTQRIIASYVDSASKFGGSLGTSIANPALLGNNFIYSTDNQTAKLEAGYRVLPQTKVTLGYTYKIINRKLSEVDHAHENAEFARVNSALPLGMNGSLGYEHSVRTGNNYNELLPWSVLGLALENASGTRIFYEANRTRDEIKGRLSASPLDTVSVGFDSRFTNNHYSETLYGLTNDYSIEAGPDVTYTPLPNLNLHAFYTYEQIYRGKNGQVLITANNGTTNVTIANTTWTQKSTDSTHTLGLSGDWQALDNLRIGAGYNFAYGDVAYKLMDGLSPAQIATGSTPTTASVFAYNSYAALAPYVIQPFPDVKSQLHSFSLHGEYQFTPQMSLWVGYTFERFIYSDAGLAALSNPLQYGNALLSGDPNPSYAVHVVGAAMRFKF